MAGLPDLKDLSLGSLSEDVAEDEIRNLTEPATVKFISESNTNILVIMRGVPGTGKSTLVQHLTQKLNTNCVCSADNYFMRGGLYTFDRTQLGRAHQDCQDKAKEYCQQGRHVVIIDNTNVVFRDFRYYVRLANNSGYVVVMVTPKAQFTTSPRVLASRNKHDVPVETIVKKLDKFEDVVPAYFAWFFNKKCSAHLSTIRDRELAKLKRLGLMECPVASGEKTIVHLTSLYVPKVVDKSKRKYITEHLLKAVGKLHGCRVDAIVVTKRTVAARVQLTSAEAKRLYHNDGPVQDDIHHHKPGYKDLAKGHAAHITLGTALGSQAAEARSDMILSQLCCMNKPMRKVVRDNITFYPEEQLAVIVLDKPESLVGIFAAYYSTYTPH